MWIRSHRSLPILLCSAALLAGCGTRPQQAMIPESSSSSAPAPRTSTASTSASMPSVSSDVTRRAVDAYQGMWHEFTVAAATSNHYSTGLALHTTGQALTALRELLYADSIAGLITLGLPVSRPRVTAVRIPEVPVEVDIVDCVDVTRWRKHKARGGLADSTPNHRVVRATARNDNEKWKVISLSLHESEKC